jgi:hypothetical protein
MRRRREISGNIQELFFGRAQTPGAGGEPLPASAPERIPA